MKRNGFANRCAIGWISFLVIVQLIAFCGSFLPPSKLHIAYYIPRNSNLSGVYNVRFTPNRLKSKGL